MDASDVIVIKQHLIDPEICIRCNTCEAICPVKAITHDSNNYVVDAAVCNLSHTEPSKLSTESSASVASGGVG